MTLSSKRAIFAGLAVDSSRWHVGGRISRSIRLFSVGAAVQQGGPVNGIHYDSHLLRVTPDQTSARYMRPVQHRGEAGELLFGDCGIGATRQHSLAGTLIAVRSPSSSSRQSQERGRGEEGRDKRKSENNDISHSSVLIPFSGRGDCLLCPDVIYNCVFIYSLNRPLTSSKCKYH